ncbi:hypothetical protein Leryth_022328, partial [Lithospermum erythrorhizon]
TNILQFYFTPTPTYTTIINNLHHSLTHGFIVPLYQESEQLSIIAAVKFGSSLFG